MTEIIITDRTIERTIYIIIILLLGILLVWSLWIRDCGPATQEETTAAVAESEAAAAATNTTETVPVEETEPEESCDDDEWNQDESDVDCGGSCDECADGKICNRDSDCDSGDCTAGKCIEVPELSGEVELSIDSIKTTTVGENEVVKVTEITITVENGLSKNGIYKIKVYAKDATNEYYLGHPEYDERDEENPYFIYTLPPIGSGDEKTVTIETGAPLLYDYSYGEPVSSSFYLEVQLIDTADDDVVDTAYKKKLE